MAIDISVGTQVSVVLGAPPTYDAAGFQSLTYVPVGKVESLPAFGGSAVVSEFTDLSTGIVEKRPGSINYGDSVMPMAYVPTDPGQIILKSGFDGANTRAVHSMKISKAGRGDLYVTFVISAFEYVFDDANAITRINSTINRTGSIVTVNAAGSTVYQVQYIAGSNGSIIGTTQQFIVDGEDATPVYALPAAGYEFVQWSDTSTDNPRQDTNVTGALTVTASFALI
jgi:hypothetical protein